MSSENVQGLVKVQGCVGFLSNLSRGENQHRSVGEIPGNPAQPCTGPKPCTFDDDLHLRRLNFCIEGFRDAHLAQLAGSVDQRWATAPWVNALRTAARDCGMSDAAVEALIACVSDEAGPKRVLSHSSEKSG